MIYYEAQILLILTGIIWFDFIGMHRIILKWFGRNPWDELKPFSCYFCTLSWFGIMTAGIICAMNLEWITCCLFIIQNTVIAKILDSILGYDSLKSK